MSSDSPTRSRGAGMRLGPRHKWMIANVAESLNLDELNVEQSFRNPDTYDRIAGVFELGGPRRLIVSIKVNANSNETDTKSDEPPSIIISDGGSVSMAGSKICYFVKTSDVQIDTDVSNDKNIVFGNLSKNLLNSVETSLGKLYKPVFEAKTAWGQAEESQTQEFSGVMNTFLNELGESMRAM
tara:strand:- start:422 stop:970 length:549 start_codon:yes stop_codon:yes gene_type:complete